ncbi:uncharacterized protein LOC126678460 [Mercurialis annua]|uniref:uncharacterized protein LOC126678460 n=1 Tax=Mercurialis annua TaxID=3986 RepID=UPI00215E7D1D|nr:uncharacterized protein LOC126678460 [Mercurialis annua]
MALSSSIAIFFFVSTLFSGDAVRNMGGEQSLMSYTKRNNVSGCNGEHTRVATLYPYSTQTWHGACFHDTNGYVSYNRDHGLGYIVISTWEAESKWCKDSYEFKVGGHTIGSDTFYLSWTNPHQVVFDSSHKDLRTSIRQNGVEVYLTNNGLCDQTMGKAKETL